MNVFNKLETWLSQENDPKGSVKSFAHTRKSHKKHRNAVDVHRHTDRTTDCQIKVTGTVVKL